MIHSEAGEVVKMNVHVPLSQSVEEIKEASCFIIRGGREVWKLTHFTILLHQNKKRRESVHARTMMHSEADKGFKMNVHHVLMRQIVVEIRLEEEWEEEVLDER
jgi:hypothetical protein